MAFCWLVSACISCVLGVGSLMDPVRGFSVASGQRLRVARWWDRLLGDGLGRVTAARYAAFRLSVRLFLLASIVLLLATI